MAAFGEIDAVLESGVEILATAYIDSEGSMTHCSICGRVLHLATRKQVFGKGGGLYWYCKDCDAFVSLNQSRKVTGPYGQREWHAELARVKLRLHRAVSLNRSQWEDRWSSKQARFKVIRWLQGRVGLQRKSYLKDMNLEQLCACRELLDRGIQCSEVFVLGQGAFWWNRILM